METKVLEESIDNKVSSIIDPLTKNVFSLKKTL